MIEQNTPEFLKSWSAEIKSKANRVRDLIGDVHWLSDGNHKETLIRAFIRSYVPDVLSIGPVSLRTLISYQRNRIFSLSTTLWIRRFCESKIFRSFLKRA